MKSCYVTEVFTSLQGEGARIGVPSIFVRLFGCNFTCSGFSQVGDIPVNKYVPPADLVDITQIDGNAFTYGCDSKYAWDKDFLRFQRKMTAKGLADLIIEHSEADDQAPVRDLIFTGGEPMLHQLFMVEVLQELAMMESKVDYVTFETNGSIPPRDDFIPSLQAVSLHGEFHYLFSFSPKLAISGEPKEKRVNLAAVEPFIELNEMDEAGCTFKFVARGMDEDFEEIKEILKVYGLHHSDPEVMVMPVGGTLGLYEENCRPVAEMCIKHGMRFSPRMHLNIWGNQVGT